MVGENQSVQSRTSLVTALAFAAIFAIVAVSGWYSYSSETDKNQAIVGENDGYRLQIRELEDQIEALTKRNQTDSDSLAQITRKTGELETVAQQLSQAKSTLEADLAREQVAKRQVEEALATERKSVTQMRQELNGLKSNYAELEQTLAQHRSEQNSLNDQVSAVSVEKQQLLDRLEQAKSKRQHLLDQIAIVSEDVEVREVELAASRQNMAQLNQELAQTRQEQHRLKNRVTQLSEQQKEEAQHFASLKQRLEQELNESRVQIAQLKNRMTVISLTSEVLFGSGSAQIKPAGREVLSVIASALNAYPDRAISIDGHTDNVPIGKGSFYKSNWELSAARALAAVNFLQDGQMVSPDRLKVVGHGEYDPVASNETPQGRQLNRRIEIRLLPPDGAETGYSDS